MSQYITQLAVSLNEVEEKQLDEQGFTKLNVNLKQGIGGNYIYLWFKKGSIAPITRIQFTFSPHMATGLVTEGYTKIEKSLNTGTAGDKIYLWYFNGSTDYDVPITELTVTTQTANEPQQYIQGWERLACDLNRNNKGNRIYLWVKREKPTFICDVTATTEFGSDATNFKNGYVRVDESTNRGNSGSNVFIWYRQLTEPGKSLTDLQISTNPEDYKSFQKQNYMPLNTNLNEGSGGNDIYLWYKKESSNPNIKAISILVTDEPVEPYEKAGVQVITKNLNMGTEGLHEYVCFYR